MPEHVETQVQHRDGHLVDVEIAAKPIAVGGRRQIVYVVRDISERKRADEAARQLASIIFSTGDAIIGVTLDYSY